jgi:endoglucanase
MSAMFKILLTSICLCATLPTACAAAGTLWGVSDSGMDFGKGPIAGRNFAVPDPAYYLSHGVTLIRVPFQISRIQSVPQGPLAPAIVADLKKIVAQDHAAGAITVLDPHGYGFYDIGGKPQDILTNAEAMADYLDLMQRIAVTFGHSDVAIGLMNEPHTGSDQDYAAIWNRAIAIIRQAGFTGVILVPHAHWSSAADISPDTPFAGTIVDPAHNWVLELHLYLDPDGTGTYRHKVVSPAIGAQRLAGAIAWSQTSGVRLFLGETGAPADPVAMAAFQAELDEIAKSKGVFWGVAVWGAGPWWKPDYPMRLDPIGGAATPQFLALEKMLKPAGHNE